MALGFVNKQSFLECTIAHMSAGYNGTLESFWKTGNPLLHKYSYFINHLTYSAIYVDTSFISCYNYSHLLYNDITTM